MEPSVDELRKPYTIQAEMLPKLPADVLAPLVLESKEKKHFGHFGASPAEDALQEEIRNGHKDGRPFCIILDLLLLQSMVSTNNIPPDVSPGVNSLVQFVIGANQSGDNSVCLESILEPLSFFTPQQTAQRALRQPQRYQHRAQSLQKQQRENSRHASEKLVEHPHKAPHNSRVDGEDGGEDDDDEDDKEDKHIQKLASISNPRHKKVGVLYGMHTRDQRIAHALQCFYSTGGNLEVHAYLKKLWKWSVQEQIEAFLENNPDRLYEPEVVVVFKLGSVKLKATTRAEKLDAVAVSIPSGVSLEMLLKKPELMLEIPWGASKILNALDQMEEEPRRDGNKIKLDICPVSIYQNVYAAVHEPTKRFKSTQLERCGLYDCPPDDCLGPNTESKRAEDDKFSKMTTNSLVSEWKLKSPQAFLLGPVLFKQEGTPVWELHVQVDEAIHSDARPSLKSKAAQGKEKEKTTRKVSTAPRENLELIYEGLASERYQPLHEEMKVSKIGGRTVSLASILRWSFSVYHMIVSVRNNDDKVIPLLTWVKALGMSPASVRGCFNIGFKMHNAGGYTFYMQPGSSDQANGRSMIMDRFRKERETSKKDASALQATDGEVLTWKLCSIPKVYQMFLECDPFEAPAFSNKKEAVDALNGLLAGDWPDELDE